MSTTLRRIFTCVFAILAIATTASGQQNYWQQEVNITIQVSLNDTDHTLSAQESIEYINNSPDELTFIWFHLWPNAYKNNKTAMAKQMVRNNESKFYFAKDEERGFIDGLNFTIDGQAAKLEAHPEFIDVAKLILNKPLKPGEKITISTPFRVKIPGDFSRLGHEGQSYQITQWYPKPAVYDRKGWHEMPYLNQGEFYSEFGKFDVSITLPENYVVGATGELQNPEEVDFLNKKVAETMARESFSTDMSFPASSAKTKTLRYVQDNVHDFAWFADKRYNVWKGEVELPHSGRKVTTWLMFYGWKAKEWLEQGTKDINDAVYYYSLWNGDYPYAHCTAVDGALSAGGGMEYPMITVTAASAIIHEVGHNWFYGILASNERVHPWMDEGLNTFMEERVKQFREPGKSGLLGDITDNPRAKALLGLENKPASGVNMLPFQMISSRGLDQPIELHSEEYTSMNYGMVVYMKSMVVFNYLKDYLGDNAFDDAMRHYYSKWKFKHPYPEDFQQALEESSHTRLDWFFKGIIGSTRQVDIKVTNAEKTAEGIKVSLKNESGMEAAIPVSTIDRRGNVLDTHWSAPFTDKLELTLPPSDTAYAVVADAQELAPETDLTDNRIRLAGPLRKWETPRLQPLLGLPRNDRAQLFWLPTLGWNTTDKWMAGIALYNSSLVEKKFNYLLMPMYSFSRGELKGMGSIDYNIYPQSIGQRITFGANAARFVNFDKVQPFAEMEFTRGIGDTPKQVLRYSFTNINENFLLENILAEGNLQAHTLSYRLSRKDAVTSFFMAFRGQYLERGSVSGLAGITTTGTRFDLQMGRSWSYSKKDKISARLFVGTNFEENSTFFYGLSGSPDYLKETIFLDRAGNNETLEGYVRQTDGMDGGFRAYIPGAFANYGLGAFNLDIDLPKVPLRIFADAGLFNNRFVFAGGDAVTSRSDLMFDAGLTLPFGPFLEVYFPVAGSNYELGGNKTGHLPEDFSEFGRNIRFNLRLNALNPFELLRTNID